MSNDVYLGNPLLKKANTPIEFTKEQVEEYIKCKKDPVYFANNYVKIVTLDAGLQPFKTYDFQNKLIIIFIIADSTSVRCQDRLVSLLLVYLISYIMLSLMTVLILAS